MTNLKRLNDDIQKIAVEVRQDDKGRPVIITPTDRKNKIMALLEKELFYGVHVDKIRADTRRAAEACLDCFSPEGNANDIDWILQALVDKSKKLVTTKVVEEPTETDEEEPTETSAEPIKRTGRPRKRRVSE